MRRIAIAILSLLLMASVALAANPHFVVGPVFTDHGTTVTASGAIAGLGNQDVTIVLQASGIATATCTNRGGNQAPGQNPVHVTVTGELSQLRPENGRVNFQLTTGAPANPTAKEAGCPNNNWTATITDVQFTSVILTVQQGGLEVLRVEQSL